MRFNGSMRLCQNARNIYGKVTQCNREFPVVDKMFLVYAAVVLLFQIFFQISPIMTFLTATPLYSMQTYLGLIGGAMVVLDLFTTKKIWQGKFALLLYVILALAAGSSLKMISYGVKENLFKLCWAAIQFVIVYSCVYRMDRESTKRYVKIIFLVMLSIWIVACCISLYQYVNRIGYMYVVNPLAKDSSSNRQGFYDNRLFGIFYTLNHAAYISLFFLITSVMYTIREKRWLYRMIQIVVECILLFHILLSGSRSALVALYVVSGLIGWFVVRNKLKIRSVYRPIVSTIAAALIILTCVFSCQAIKDGLSHVPYWKDMIVYQLYVYRHPTEVPTEVPTDETDEVFTAHPMVKPEQNDDMLVREGLDEDVSNGRLSIWMDYISLYKEIGLTGLSPGNYMPYILENYPELYIVDYIKHHYPDKYESGIIYHVHSGYMMVYVSAGILGFACLALFIALCVIRVLRLIRKNSQLSLVFIGAFALVTAGAISAVFDEGLFFQNNPQTTMFWFALGLLMKEDLAEADMV